ncbi:MAG: hypothetical protein ACNA7K_06480 [Acholeplasmataceae bacterium]
MIGIASIIALIILYVMMGRQIPIHTSNMKVGSESIYFQETSRFIHCDIAYDEVIVHEDGTYEYLYELIPIGNGSCVSDLYIWDNFKYYKLSEAIEIGIISLEDFIESDVVIKRLITTSE